MIIQMIMLFDKVWIAKCSTTFNMIIMIIMPWIALEILAISFSSLQYLGASAPRTKSVGCEAEKKWNSAFVHQQKWRGSCFKKICFKKLCLHLLLSVIRKKNVAFKIPFLDMFGVPGSDWDFARLLPVPNINSQAQGASPGRPCHSSWYPVADTKELLALHGWYGWSATYPGPPGLSERVKERLMKFDKFDIYIYILHTLWFFNSLPWKMTHRNRWFAY